MPHAAGYFDRLLLWVFVIVMGIGVGAGLYEAVVITPLWAGSPPESFWGWRDIFAANPRYAPHGGDRFWIFVTPARGLLGLVLLITAIRLRGQERMWRLIAGTLTLGLFAIAALWLIPMSMELFGRTAPGADEVVSITNEYVILNYVFQALGFAAFLAGLRALVLDVTTRDPLKGRSDEGGAARAVEAAAARDRAP